jgi:hypothetical protein
VNRCERAFIFRGAVLRWTTIRAILQADQAGTPLAALSHRAFASEGDFRCWHLADMATVSGQCPLSGVKRTLVELSEKLGSVKFTKFCKILFAPTKSRRLMSYSSGLIASFGASLQRLRSHVLAMNSTTEFECPNCAAKYKLVWVEAPPRPDREISCVSCGGPLRGRQGSFVLKYFLVERPKRCAGRC